jgi:hypothetical protein
VPDVRQKFPVHVLPSCFCKIHFSYDSLKVDHSKKLSLLTSEFLVTATRINYWWRPLGISYWVSRRNCVIFTLPLFYNEGVMLEPRGEGWINLKSIFNITVRSASMNSKCAFLHISPTNTCLHISSHPPIHRFPMEDTGTTVPLQKLLTAYQRESCHNCGYHPKHMGRDPHLQLIHCVSKPL